MSIASGRAVAAVLLVLAACSTAPPHGPETGGGTSGGGSGPTTSGSSGGGVRTTGTPERPRHFAVAPSGMRLPVAVQREVAVAEGSGQVLVAGGLDASGSSTEAAYRLSPATGSVTGAGAMSSPFHDSAGAIVDGRLVVFGGGSSSGTDVVQALGGSVIGHLPSPASDLGAAAVGHDVVLVGGYDGSTFLTSVLATRDGVSFRRIGTLPAGLRYAAVAAVGQHVIVSGGLTTAGPVATILRIDVPGGSVRTIGRLPTPLAHAAALTLGGHVYVLGGENAAGRTVRTVERIDPRTGRVRSAHPLPGTVADAAAVALGPDRGLLIGGRRGPQGDDVPLPTIVALRLAR